MTILKSTSRRSLLTAAAAIAASTGAEPALAAALPDPTFALIERHRAAAKALEEAVVRFDAFEATVPKELTGIWPGFDTGMSFNYQTAERELAELVRQGGNSIDAPAVHIERYTTRLVIRSEHDIPDGWLADVGRSLGLIKSFPPGSVSENELHECRGALLKMIEDAKADWNHRREAAGPAHFVTVLGSIGHMQNIG